MTRREKIWLGFLMLLGGTALIAGLALDANTDRNALLEAASNGHLEEVRRLVTGGTDVDARSQAIGGCTALYAAAGRGYAAVVALLLQHGADPNLACTDRDNAWQSRGKTPLHVAINVNIADLLLNHGAEIHARDGDGFTPIHRAIEAGDVDLVKYLMQRGAKLPRKWNNPEHAPLRLASGRFGSVRLLEFLAERGYEISADDISPLFVSTSPEITRFWLERGLDPNVAGPGGNTPLHFLTTWLSIDSIDVLVAHGADVNRQNKDGDTPLHYAARHGANVLIVQTLLDHGADPTIVNRAGETTLDAMVNGGWDNHIDGQRIRSLIESSSAFFDEGSP